MIWLTIPAALLALLAALVALRHWMASPARVLDEIEALTDVPAHIKADLLDCIDAAQDADRKTWLYDLSAPIVMLLVLPFVKREADRLPRLFSAWDNNVSLNGDGEAVLRDGKWLTAGHDISWEEFNAAVAAGERRYTYDDPDYTGDAYYARGHHPRSFWARYVWVGLRNRASMLSVKLGRDVTARPVVVSGDPTIHRHGPYGHCVLRHGDTFHYKSIRAFGPFALTRSYGYKLGIVRNSPSGTGRAAAVAIGRSLKRRQV
jgi:hypothetical protein